MGKPHQPKFIVHPFCAFLVRPSQGSQNGWTTHSFTELRNASTQSPYIPDHIEQTQFILFSAQPDGFAIFIKLILNNIFYI